MRLALITLLITLSAVADEARYYTIETLPTPEGVPFEVSGLAMLPDGRLAISIRKGEVWALENPDAPVGEQRYTLIANALHEPLGLLAHKGGLYTAQRSELTRMEDRDGDGVVDLYRTINNGWGVSGNYHEYAFGPVVDAHGDFWLTLNQTIGKTVTRERAWRGWGVRIDAAGTLHPVAPGMRSPCGIGQNLAGDVFFSDQQGNWVPAGTLHHLREGVFYGHTDALRDVKRPGATVTEMPPIPEGKPYPEAVRECEPLVPPAVWFPYRKMGMSATDIIADATQGTFGPFAGQLFVGDFTMAQVNRVFLEEVNGEYQGGCVLFRGGFQSAVLRFAWTPKHSLFVGETNRGWNSAGSTPFGLERVRWTGETPFEILNVRAQPDGFLLSFTQPVYPVSVTPEAFTMSSYTYTYHRNYGSDEINTQTPTVTAAEPAPNRLSIRLRVDGLREGYVHEIHANGLRNSDGETLLHPAAYYTLNAIPSK